MSVFTNRWSWYELLTSDPEGAKAFYRAVVGYGFAPWPDPAMAYTLVQTPGGRAMGGMMQLPVEVAAAGVPSHWIGTIEVQDVDAVAARVVALGGKVMHPPSDIPNVGRFANFLDPQGAAFSVMSPAQASTDPLPGPEVGGVCWAELWAPAPEAVLGFYGELFGWVQQSAMDMGEHGTYRIYGMPNDPNGIGGIAKLMPGQPAPAWLFYFIVEGIEAAVERIRGAGGQVIVGPQEVPGGGRFVIGCDPQGAVFAVLSIT